MRLVADQFLQNCIQKNIQPIVTPKHPQVAVFTIYTAMLVIKGKSVCSYVSCLLFIVYRICKVSSIKVHTENKTDEGRMYLRM